MFTIREVNLTDSFTYLGSDNLHSIAKEHGFWDGKGLLDFTKAYSGGDYGHKYYRCAPPPPLPASHKCYSGRRMWSALRHFVPSMHDALGDGQYGNLRDDKPLKPWGKSTFPW
jgi:hypothetical protein